MLIEKRVKTNRIYNIVYAKWYNMMHRCYDKNNKDYKYYGQKGITVCDEWHSLNNFIEDFDKINGFDLELLKQGKLHLDKDINNISNQYSLSSCSLILKEINNAFKPCQQFHITAISPTGEVFKFYNQSEFAKQHNLRQNCISKCANGKGNHHKGWKFYK